MKVLLFPRFADGMLETARRLAPDGIELVVLGNNPSEEEVATALGSVEAVMGFVRAPLTSPRAYEAMAHLKLVQLVSAGYDALDLGVMRRLRVPVATNGGANAVGVAEHTILLILAVYRNLAVASAATRAGSWRMPALGQQELLELAGKTVGLVGLGMIGREVAKRLRSFETTILYHDAFRADAAVEESLGVRFVPLSDLLSSSDVVTLHVPLLPETHHMIGEEELRTMRSSAILINTCRGGVVDGDALCNALKEGEIAGAGLDTLETEPPTPDLPLLSMPNVTVTPHIAGITQESYPRRFRNGFANLERVAAGHAPHWVVPELRDLVSA